MQGYILKKFLISIFLLVSALYSRDVEVCLWSGENPEAVIKKFQGIYNKGVIYTTKYAGKSLIINRVDIEDYLAGVLAKEMDNLWPVEALKAQAVVSRTFTIYLADINRSKKLPYDIKNSILNQVYNPSDISKKIEESVKSTFGEVLSYKGKIVQVFFHACCGGKTAYSSDVWGGIYPHISSVVDPYCKNTPYYKWEKTFTGNQISNILRLSRIDRIEVWGRDDSGRATLLKVFLKNGNITTLTGHRFRIQVNNSASKILFTAPDVLPSTYFTVKKEGEEFIFEGFGYGHGVGMCQWGSRIMAEKGFGYEQILNHYFPKLEIGNLILGEGDK
jgi:stage II sporulation protein D